MAVDWGYYDKYETLVDKYMPSYGEGETKASQTVTAVNKLIYKWYNDGDVFDNTYHLKGWANDLSDYANWIYENTKDGWKILNKIENCMNESDYEDLLKELADELLNETYLAKENEFEKVDSIYSYDGKFKFVEEDDYNDDYWYDDDDDEEEEEDDEEWD